MDKIKTDNFITGELIINQLFLSKIKIGRGT